MKQRLLKDHKTIRKEVNVRQAQRRMGQPTDWPSDPWIEVEDVATTD